MHSSSTSAWLEKITAADFGADDMIRAWLTRDSSGVTLWADHPRRDSASGLWFGGDMLPLNIDAGAIPDQACLQVEIRIIPA